ncbi:carbon-nitrogen hydrolase family protein [Aliikangiella coralliicola]|uniref:Carbon-nitrogen hydrolase family protein n=1 Tax=Aliikangiella coralliicola TaxID=2592383 RepID=A0A545UB30_9GAMM|nr:carbon-nitrogen hydrolase family protein [Aliikangiella coralliicola]TQV86665.1 carbon-nitrogen hydrolase family protein [Aliikangiella coralliicola]
MKNNVKVSAVQMVSATDLPTNLETAARLIGEAVRQGADIIVLPEYFAIMAENEAARVNCTEIHGAGPVQDFLSEQALRWKVWIIGGTHPVVSQINGRPFGRCYVINPKGEKVAWYDKIHLFDVSVDDQQKNYAESEYCFPGDSVCVFETPWGKAGLAVCYDLRFPELFRQLSELGADLIFIPAAFTYVTGKAHWLTLLKARAIENLSVVVASAQGGKHQNGRETWGHSCIISSWGEVLTQLNDGDGVVVADIDLIQHQKIRNEFPVLSHRRL